MLKAKNIPDQNAALYRGRVLLFKVFQLFYLYLTSSLSSSNS